jgi:glycosyltransferase involved in cell wall biosynthesis
MHICHIITRLIIGGAQENTVLTCRGLVDLGHEVTLIAGPETGPEGSLWEAAEASGAKLIKLDSLRRAIRPRQDRRACAELTELLRDLEPDVFHTHSSKAGILGRWAARRAGTPIVVHTIHGMSFNRTQPWAKQMLFRTLERRAARHTDMIVTVADAMIEQSVRAKIAPRDRFFTVRSGMETATFGPDPQQRTEVRQGWGMDDDVVVVGTIARLFENKGYDEILAAMPAAVQAAPQLRFVWVGDGKHRDLYVRQLEAMGLRDRVHLTGLVPTSDIPHLLTGFDIVLHASRWEGLPRALVQGLLTEVPAVSFDNDGAPEVVIDIVTGKLVPYGDIKRLSEALVELAHDPDLRRRLGTEGRHRCLEAFDWRHMVHELDHLYQRLVERKASGR